MRPLQAKYITPLRCKGQPGTIEYVWQSALAQQLNLTLFQGAQIRANRLAAGSRLAKLGPETRVVRLVTVSDATY